MGVSEGVFQVLLRELQEGVYAEGSRFPSEYLLADRFGINKSTAAKVTLRLVEQGCLRRGVRGEGTLVSMASRFPAGMFAFLCRELTPYADRLLTGVQKAALRQRCSVILWPDFQENAADALRLLSPRCVRGLFVVQNESVVSPYGLPVVYLDRDHPEADSVTNCNCDGGERMMREILRHRHREILIFNTSRFSYFSPDSVHMRVRGFWNEMEKAGITDCRERSALCVPHTLQDAAFKLRQMLESYPRTTLIATDSDETAELLWAAARYEKIPLGESIALTGFGNCSQLPIASVEQYPELVGECALKLLCRRIAEGPGKTIHEQIKTTLVHLEYLPYA